MGEEKGKMQLIYEEGFEQGWREGYDAAIYFCTHAPERINKKNPFIERIA